MDLHARLFAAVDAARTGDQEHALRELMWIHEHSLDVDSAFYGVRLSFALGAWAELAAVYPPAREALIATRAAKAQQVLAGDGTRDTVHDIEAIDRHLDVRATYDFFIQLRGSQPTLARQCGDLVWHVVAQFGDAALARECVEAPDRVVAMCSDILNDCAAKLPTSERTRRAILKPVVSTWTEHIRLLLHVLATTGDAAEADRLRTGFLDALRDPMVRHLAARHLAEAA